MFIGTVTSVIAYNAATGAMIWQASGTGSLAVSPDGSTVFAAANAELTGQNIPEVMAYNATTGAMLWQALFTGSFGTWENVAVSPGGSTVFVTGVTGNGTGSSEYSAVAYNALTGAQLWTESSSVSNFEADTLAVSPDGSAVYVAETRYSTSDRAYYETVAYNAATGATLWQQAYKGSLKSVSGGPSAVTVSPDGSSVFVTGTSTISSGRLVCATLAYGAQTGSELWLARINDGAVNEALDIAASPNGSAVFVTGFTTATLDSLAPVMATVAYTSGGA